jgi:hypothetical protein
VSVDDPGRYDAGMPRGTAALALDLATAAAEAASSLTGTVHRVDPAAVFAHLVLPLVVGDAQTPRPPVVAPSGGWVHTDVIDDDESLFALLVDEPPPPDAEALAARAQACRLPVTPYRTEAPTWEARPNVAAGPRVVRPVDVSVLDLTTMWAGPLCTHLLAELGAHVTTVAPAARPDGLRGSPRQFAAFAQNKRRVPWDLHERDDRAAFERAVAGADVLVESFSDRVMPNLGYSVDELWRVNPRLRVIALRAFPASSWVAFGRGVHAAGGLGMVAGAPTPALLAYPDPLAGLAAFGATLGALADPDGCAIEISLAGAIAPLLATAGRPLGEGDPDAIAQLAPPGRALLRER